MFSMGGRPEENSGIVAGFEREKLERGTRPVPGGYSPGTYDAPLNVRFPEVTSSMDFQPIADLITAAKQSAPDLSLPAASTTPQTNLVEDVTQVFGGPPAGSERGFGMAEYLALAKLGANIASAPNQGKGFSGFVRSAAPAVGQFADDIGTLDAQKRAERNAYAASLRDAHIGAMSTQAELDAARNLQAQADAAAADRIERQADADIRVNEQDLIKIDKQFKKYDELEAEYLDNQQKILNLDPGLEDYNQVLGMLQQKEQRLIEQMYAALEQDLPEVPIIEGLPLTGALETADKRARDKLGLAVNPSPSDPLYNEFRELSLQYAREEIKRLRDLIKPKTGKETKLPEREDNADGGRIGFQEGGTAALGAAPGMTGSSEMTGSPLTFAELRARLPKEVSNDVVRLLAASENALIAFAQIQTQDDISRFNQTYNTDLQLPAQQAV